MSGSDPFVRLKFVGYCMASLPPEGFPTDFNDMLHFCKFFLCKKSGHLMGDPIWDSYSDEEVISEYYAHIYAEDKKQASEFIKGLGVEGLNETDSFLEWADSEMEKDNKDLEEKFPDEVTFSPESLGE